MGLDLGRKGDYALRAMIALAGSDVGARMKAREIAAATGVPATYLPQVLAELARSGLVTSVAGPRGGYATARPPEAISVLEVIESVGGPVRSTICPMRGGPCTPEQPCPLHRVWGDAQDALAAKLAASTLQAVIDTEKDPQSWPAPS
jgi:Rrf2 family transcriptional regulator, iron-sulfur cluster assembly transcription factor